jgi:hypothetical protein
MKIDAIRPRSYFLDYVKVNWKMPLNDMSQYDKNLIHFAYKCLIPIVNKLIDTEEFRCVDFLQYDNLKKQDILYMQRRKDIQIEWSGKFFVQKISKKIENDTYEWYDSFMKIDEVIRSHYYRILRQETGKEQISNKRYELLCTVSRVDIARNHLGDLTHAIPIANKNIKEISYYEANERKGKSYITGLAIGKRNAENGIYFRAYDKRYDLDGIESSLQRFKTIYYVRKEWELKRKSLRRFLITHPRDFFLLVTEGLRRGIKSISPSRKLTELIFRIRKNSDCILLNDNMLYRSIHDDLTRKHINPLDGYTIPENTFNSMIKRDYSLFMNRLDPKKIKRKYWNPMSRLNGIIEKKGMYLDAEEILTLMTKLFGHLDIKELKNDDEYQNKIKDVMKFIGTDKRIKTALKEIEAKKKEVFKYTQSLVKQYKKNKAARI